MSAKHPIIAITGSSGAGTTTTGFVFRKIFQQLKLNVVEIAGDSFHLYSRQEMKSAIALAERQGQHISYLSPEANDLAMLERTFSQYGRYGHGQLRHYLHTLDEAKGWGQVPGTFTPWEAFPANSDMLFYEGLHGGIVTEQRDIAAHVDLLVGVVPIVNIEWIQKMIRDTKERGHAKASVKEAIVSAMEDYITYITPQFSRTHINLQRVPTIDTSDPFAASSIPTLSESFVVIHLRQLTDIHLPRLLSMLQGSFLSRSKTLVVPGVQMENAINLIMTPLIKQLIQGKPLK